MEKRLKLMENGKISKILLVFGIPSIIGFVVNALYNFFDALFVGQLGTEQMGAATVVFPIVLVIVGLGHIFGAGASSYISRLLGSYNREKAQDTLSISFFLSIIAAGIVTILGLIFIDDILKVFGATESILPYALDYAYIYMGGCVFQLVAVTLSNTIRAQGAMFYSMFAMLLGSILNVILDPLFIFIFGWGIRGAAVATILSQAIAMVFLIVFYMKKDSLLKIKLKDFGFSKGILIEIFKIGMPQFIFQLLSSIAIGLLNGQAAAYGDETVAAVGIVNRIMLIGMYVIFGYTKGMQPIVGFSYGSKNFKRLKDSINFSFIYCTVFSIVYSIVQIVFGSGITGWFSSDANVIGIASKGLLYYSITFPLFSISMIFATMYLAIGKAREGGFLSFCRQGICFFPLVFTLPVFFGITGILLVQPIADILTFLITLIFIWAFYKNINKKIDFERVLILDSNR
jgi:putative MATE family efflux protein